LATIDERAVINDRLMRCRKKETSNIRDADNVPCISVLLSFQCRRLSRMSGEIAAWQAWTMRRWRDFRQWIILLISQDTSVIAPCTLRTGGLHWIRQYPLSPPTRAHILGTKNQLLLLFRSAFKDPETITLYL